MMYFEYNHEGKRPLRIPMTEEAFLKAKDEPDRWFINFGSCVLEVTKPEYDKYYKEKERSRYIRRNAAGRHSTGPYCSAADRGCAHKSPSCRWHTSR